MGPNFQYVHAIEEAQAHLAGTLLEVARLRTPGTKGRSKATHMVDQWEAKKAQAQRREVKIRLNMGQPRTLEHCGFVGNQNEMIKDAQSRLSRAIDPSYTGTIETVKAQMDADLETALRGDTPKGTTVKLSIHTPDFSNPQRSPQARSLQSRGGSPTRRLRPPQSLMTNDSAPLGSISKADSTFLGLGLNKVFGTEAKPLGKTTNDGYISIYGQQALSKSAPLLRASLSPMVTELVTRPQRKKRSAFCIPAAQLQTIDSLTDMSEEAQLQLVNHFGDEDSPIAAESSTEISAIEYKRSFTLNSNSSRNKTRRRRLLTLEHRMNPPVYSPFSIHSNSKKSVHQNRRSSSTSGNLELSLDMLDLTSFHNLKMIAPRQHAYKVAPTITPTAPHSAVHVNTQPTDKRNKLKHLRGYKKNMSKAEQLLEISRIGYEATVAGSLVHHAVGSEQKPTRAEKRFTRLANAKMKL